MGPMVIERSKTKTAIPLFGDRVSPHFGSSSRFLVLVRENETLLDEVVFDFKEAGPMQQARELLNLGVGEVICGGIERRFREWLVSKGVAVIENQKGRVAEVVEELLGRKNILEVGLRLIVSSPVTMHSCR